MKPNTVVAVASNTLRAQAPHNALLERGINGIGPIPDDVISFCARGGVADVNVSWDGNIWKGHVWGKRGGGDIIVYSFLIYVFTFEDR